MGKGATSCVTSSQVSVSVRFLSSRKAGSLASAQHSSIGIDQAGFRILDPAYSLPAPQERGLDWQGRTGVQHSRGVWRTIRASLGCQLGQGRDPRAERGQEFEASPGLIPLTSSCSLFFCTPDLKRPFGPEALKIIVVSATVLSRHPSRAEIPSENSFRALPVRILRGLLRPGTPEIQTQVGR